MNKTHTPDALVQFLFRELSAFEAVETAQLIDHNPVVRAEYATLQAAKMQLPKVHFNPSANVLQRVMQYSATTALEVQY